MTERKSSGAFLLAALCASAAFFMCGEKAAGQERFRKSAPYPEPLAELRLPDIQNVTLSNGLKVTVAQKSGSAFVSVQLVILAGERDCPDNVPGTAAATASLLSRGTPALSSSDIEERIEAIGADFSSRVFLDYTIFIMDVLEENLDQALEILSLMILQAGFSDRELEGLKRTSYYELLEKGKDPEFVARAHLARLLFQGHPYQKGVYTEDVIRNITRKDIQAFHGRFYRPNNALIILSGNLNLTTASRKISHYFNTWTPRPVERESLPEQKPNDKDIVCVVDLPQARDATIYAGNLIMPLSSPDYFPFLVLNQALGGTTSSRLFMNLRESKGYAYYAFSETEFFKSCGLYWAKARVTPSAVYGAVQEILKDIRGLAAEKISSFEIEQAKSFLIGNFPLKNEPLHALCYRLSLIRAFGLGDEHWNKFYDAIMLVNVNRGFETAQKYLLSKPVVVIVGDRNAVADYLRDFDRIDVYDAKGKMRFTMMKGVER